MKQIHEKIFIKTIFLLSAIFLIGILCFMAAEQYKNWQGRGYFGEVIRMTDTGFVVRSGANREYTIDLSPQTILKQGGQTMIDGVTIGSLVMVVGGKDVQDHTQATIVRIMKNRRSVFSPQNVLSH